MSIIHQTINQQMTFKSKIFPVLEKRISHDTTVNARGREFLDLCSAHDLTILNGRTKGDFLGKFTCHKYNGNSTVDYAIVSDPLLSCVEEFRVQKLSYCSDHSPITIQLKFSFTPTIDKVPYPIFRKFLWNNDAKQKVQDEFQREETSVKVNQLLQQQELSTDELTNKITNLITSVSKKCRKMGPMRRPSHKTHKIKLTDETLELRRLLLNITKARRAILAIVA